LSSGVVAESGVGGVAISDRGDYGNLWVLRISILPQNYSSKMGFSAPNVVFLEGNCPTRRTFSDKLKLTRDNCSLPLSNDADDVITRPGSHPTQRTQRVAWAIRLRTVLASLASKRTLRALRWMEIMLSDISKSNVALTDRRCNKTIN